MIPHKTSKSIRTHQHIRTMRSLRTKVGPAQGHWSRVRESEHIRVRLHRVQPA